MGAGCGRAGLCGRQRLGDRAGLGVQHSLETTARRAQPAVDHDDLRLRALRRRLRGDAAGRPQRSAQFRLVRQRVRGIGRHAELIGPPGLVRLQPRGEGGIAVALRRLADAAAHPAPPLRDLLLQALAGAELALEAQQRHGHQPADARVHLQHHVRIDLAIRQRRLHRSPRLQRHQLERRAARVAALRARVARGRVRVHGAARAPVHAGLDVQRHPHGAVPPAAGHVAPHQGGQGVAVRGQRQRDPMRLEIAHGQRQRPPQRQVHVEPPMLRALVAHRRLVADGALPVARMIGSRQATPRGAEVGFVGQQLRDARAGVLLADAQLATALLVEMIEYGARRQRPVDAHGAGGRVGDRGHSSLISGRA